MSVFMLFIQNFFGSPEQILSHHNKLGFYLVVRRSQIAIKKEGLPLRVQYLRQLKNCRKFPMAHIYSANPPSQSNRAIDSPSTLSDSNKNSNAKPIRSQINLA
jgi:hypothetical protein